MLCCKLFFPPYFKQKEGILSRQKITNMGEYLRKLLGVRSKPLEKSVI